MKEKDFLSTLALLQKIEPSPNTIKEIREEVIRRIEHEEAHRAYTDQESLFARFFHTLFYGRFLPAFFVILLLLIGAGAMMSGGGTLSFITRVKIAFAANVYEKAQLEFDVARSELEKIKTQKNFNKKDEERLASAVGSLNTSMAHLNLEGEEGKYTEEQCLELYRRYHAYLQEIEKIMRDKKETDPTIQQFLSRISDYEEEAEKRIGLYK